MSAMFIKKKIVSCDSKLKFVLPACKHCLTRAYDWLMRLARGLQLDENISQETSELNCGLVAEEKAGLSNV